MEGDLGDAAEDAGDGTISIPSLRMEGDDFLDREIPEDWEFQSTPSAWRETVHRMHSLLS